LRDAPTAEALMRSRYTAFVLGDSEYLLSTWDPASRPSRLDLRRDRAQWLSLQILASEAGGEADVEGRVEFIARYRLDGKDQEQRENSRFRKDGDRWLYVDGQVGHGTSAARIAPVVKSPAPGRNDPCTCGSGQKFKRCCGA
jgi:SEC-C motif-containing protein